MKRTTPTLRRHRRSRHGYARLDGRQIWFGPYDDPETHQRFARAVAEWLANGRRLPSEEARKDLRVADIVAAYLEYAERFYSGPDGKPTREVENIALSVRLLLKLYGTLPVREFGLRQVKTLREQMITDELVRKTINDRINRVVRLFGWAAEEELCPAEIYGALRALRSLKRGRSAAKEGKRVLPVAWTHVEAVLPHVSRQVAGLIELMWHTGMRPGEACQLRPGELDTSGAVWFYRPRSHKTQHFGRERVVPIGPRGQAVLRRFLSRVPAPAPSAPLFSPRDAMAELRAARRKDRKTPLWPSHQRHQALKRKRDPRKEPKEAYTPSSLMQAIKAGCKEAAVPSWSPNQLRHAAATRIRKETRTRTGREHLLLSRGFWELRGGVEVAHAPRRCKAHTTSMTEGGIRLRREVAISVGWGVLFASVLGVLIVVGSRNLAHFDAALVGYTFATLFAVFGLTYRYSMWLQRPPTALYWRRGWQVFFRRGHKLANARTWTRRVAGDFVLNRFILRRGSMRWLAHFLLMWGCLVAAAITFPLVFGWLHFETPGNDMDVYRVVLFGIPTVEIRVGTLPAFLVFHGLVWSAILVIGGVMLAMRRRMRDEGAAALQKFHEDFLPLVLLFAVSLTGLLLTASYTWMKGYAYDFLAIIHAVTVIFTLLWLPFGKFFHVFQRPAQMGVSFYKEVGTQEEPAKCRRCGAAFTSRMHVDDLIDVQHALGFRFEDDGQVAHYQWICPPCRRALVAIAQARSFGRELAARVPGQPTPTPAYANPGVGSGPLGSEDRSNFHP